MNPGELREPVTPKRIQLKRTKGWRKPEGAITVARPSKWGNPFRVGEWVRLDYSQLPVQITPTVAVVLFLAKLGSVLAGEEGEAQRAHLESDLAPLRGHDLACWCPLDQPCHADVLLELANP